MNKACELCKGACCESIVVDGNLNTKVDEWLVARGRSFTINTIGGVPVQKIEIETVCPSLSLGKCIRYEFRPEMCKEFEVGSKDCRDTVKRRRENWESIFALF